MKLNARVYNRAKGVRSTGVLVQLGPMLAKILGDDGKVRTCHPKHVRPVSEQKAKWR